MASHNTPAHDPWTTRILSDFQHFAQTSRVDRDEQALTTAKHSISLDLEDTTVMNAVRGIFAKDALRAADAAAQDPALAAYLSRLGIIIPQAGDSREDSTQQFTPIDNPSNVDQGHKEDRSMIPDRLLRISHSSLGAGNGGQFPMLIAVTQAYLNAQLHARWTAEAELDRSELRNMVLPDCDDDSAARWSLPAAGVFIDAELAAPHISLLVENSGGAVASSSAALFYLNFLQGRSALWDEEAGELCEIASTFDWKIAFKVDLQLLPLYKMSFEYRCLANHWGLTPSHDINALVVSFNNVTIDIPSSTFPTPLPASVHTSLAELITANLRRRSVTINYAVTTSRSASPIASPAAAAATVQDPTVPPTGLRLQTSPYRESLLSTSGPSVSNSGPDNNQPLNTLLYLPAGVSSQLPWSANWVPSEVDEDNNNISGALVLGREAFLESFLLPRLTGLNKATYFEMMVAETNQSSIPFQAEYKFEVGRKDDDGLGDGDFAWTRMDALSTASKGVSKYIWSRSSDIRDTDGENGFGSKVKGTTLAQNVLIVRGGGTNRIRWETEAQVKFETELETFGVVNKGTSTIWRKGATDIVVDEVDGKLGLRIEMPNGWVKTGSTTDKTSFGLMRKELEKLCRELDSKYLRTDQIIAMVDKINSRLTRKWAWVYPTFGESFTMKDPVFSDELDLLVDLAYSPIQTEEF